MTAKKERLDWPDIAKGLSIFGVVLLHVSLAIPEGMDTFVAQLNRFLDPLRMPLFFLVSGFFSAKVFRLSLRELFLSRLWFFLVPYVIWAPIELWLKFREYHMFDGSEMPGIGRYLGQLLTGTGMYWFLFALVVFNLILWATRTLPSWGAVLVSFSPILLLPLHSDVHMVGKAVLYLPVFIIGAHFRQKIADFAAGGTSVRNLSRSLILYAVAFSVSSSWVYLNTVAEISVTWPLPGPETINYFDLRLVVNSVVQLAMMPMAIMFAIMLSKVPVLSNGLKFLGRHTLVIYLGHPLALTVLYHYNMRAVDLPISRDAESWLNSTAFWMVIGLVISAIGAFVLWIITQIPYLRWTLMPPRLPFWDATPVQQSKESVKAEALELKVARE
ncbi:acyltransferase family protein [Corynebacterium alimapuense]|uniref:Acyltransferase 3 domain-containing protein n=1 Tax=Corynebacterium alimapuense TaxID=1576874 RepID=A0A3M8K9N0_9CORY|nr:acyltransferase family protein [Corynebacterium alimapuense]RNE49505.1 hypothetical protein C5L39_03905 [Corynebacterium alimapuense]